MPDLGLNVSPDSEVGAGIIAGRVAGSALGVDVVEDTGVFANVVEGEVDVFVDRGDEHGAGCVEAFGDCDVGFDGGAYDEGCGEGEEERYEGINCGEVHLDQVNEKMRKIEFLRRRDLKAMKRMDVLHGRNSSAVKKGM